MDPQQILQYPHATAPAAGTSLEIAPGLRWLRMPLPFALEHINLWLLEDGEGWTIVDCGIASDPSKGLWEQIFATLPGGQDRPVRSRRVLVTHFHPDHAGLAHWLCQRFGATLWMSQAEYLTVHAIREGVAGYTPDNLLGMYRRNGLDAAALEKMAVRGNRYRLAVPAFPHNYRRIMDGDEIAIGACNWRVIMGYGHAPEHAALYSPELGVLISGDMVLPKISTNISVWSIDPEGNPLQQFLRSLKRHAELPADTLVLPSHGLPFRGLRERVEQLEEHHSQHFEELHEACAQPLSAFEAIPALFQRELDTHQLFFAMGEAMAHLHYLYYQGSLRRSTDADGVIRYLQDAALRKEPVPT
ncbi:MAG: MBL fold metallo-hydrolase [Burkholderiales bacterium]|nr:MBL fold metallo-hydrolase [Burkholderiales bacterium]